MIMVFTSSGVCTPAQIRRPLTLLLPAMLAILLCLCAGVTAQAHTGSPEDDSQQPAAKRSDSQRHIEMLTRRSALDKNFLRFGRGGSMDNFMRFGRAGNVDNFMRFGRAGKMDNFMRFGRGDQSNFMRFGRREDEDASLAQDDDAYLRYARLNGGGGTNFIRFGRSPELRVSEVTDPDSFEDQQQQQEEEVRSPAGPQHGTWRERRSSSSQSLSPPLPLNPTTSSSTLPYRY